MLQPKRTTYRKMHKGKNRGIAWKGSEISFGSFALKALENVRITSRQIESARIMFELEGVTPQVAKEALELAAQKLPLKCAIVTRHDYIES